MPLINILIIQILNFIDKISYQIEDDLLTQEELQQLQKILEQQQINNKIIPLEKLLYQSEQIINQYNNVVDLQIFNDTIVYFIGDIHGKFNDLITCLNIIQNDLKQQTYNNWYIIQLGDIIDRGYQSVECILMLIILQLRYPNNIIILRGNHCCEQICAKFGFFEQCQQLWFNQTEFYQFINYFTYLPIGVKISYLNQSGYKQQETPKLLLSNLLDTQINKFHKLYLQWQHMQTDNDSISSSINRILSNSNIEEEQESSDQVNDMYKINSILAVHGGIGQHVKTIDNINSQIRCLNDFSEQSHQDYQCIQEILWSDYNKSSPYKFERNNIRQAGQIFNYQALNEFLADNNLNLIIRGHENTTNGYQVQANGKLLTVFSSSNYSVGQNTQGGILKLQNHNIYVQQFKNQKITFQKSEQYEIKDYFL